MPQDNFNNKPASLILSEPRFLVSKILIGERYIYYHFAIYLSNTSTYLFHPHPKFTDVFQEISNITVRCRERIPIRHLGYCSEWRHSEISGVLSRCAARSSGKISLLVIGQSFCHVVYLEARNSSLQCNVPHLLISDLVHASWVTTLTKFISRTMDQGKNPVKLLSIKI